MTGLRMIRHYKPAVMMSTFPIATAHMIGKTLCKLTGIPWIADFRDNMTDPDFPRDPVTWRFNRRLEVQTSPSTARGPYSPPEARCRCTPSVTGASCAALGRHQERL